MRPVRRQLLIAGATGLGKQFELLLQAAEVVE
jgi:hypothetical protein